MSKRNIDLVGYKLRIIDPKNLTVKDAKSILATIARGLWDTDHTKLRDNVSDLRHDLVDVKELTEDLYRRLGVVVAAFNALDIESLNKALLDDVSLLPGEPVPPTKPPTPSESDPPTKPEPVASIDTDAVADKVLNGMKPFMATNAEGEIVKAASQADLDNAKERITALENRPASTAAFPFDPAIGVGTGLTLLVLAMLGFIISGASVTVALFWGAMVGLTGLVFGGVIGFAIKAEKVSSPSSTK